MFATYEDTITGNGKYQGDIYFDLDNTKRIKLANDVDRARTLYAGVTKTNDVSGRWNVDIEGIDALYDGLTILVELSVTYNSTYNTLNVNNLGDKLVWYRNNSRLTSHIPSKA